MECEMCTEMTRRGGAGKSSGIKGCRGPEHGQACICTEDCTDAVAVRAAHESAVQLGRGLARPRSEQASRNGHTWPTLRNVGIAYRLHPMGSHALTGRVVNTFCSLSACCMQLMDLKCVVDVHAFWSMGKDAHEYTEAENTLPKCVEGTWQAAWVYSHVPKQDPSIA
jgi:hypothetical protein